MCHEPHLGSQRSLGGTGEGFYPLVLNMNLCPDLGAPAALPYRDILPHCPSMATFVPTVTHQGLSRCLLGCWSTATPAFPTSRKPHVASACPPRFSVPTVGHPGGFTSRMFSPDRSSVPPFLWSSRAQCHWNPPWNPPILPKPLCPGFPRSGHSRAPGAHPGPQGPAGDEQGRAVPARAVFVLKLGTASQKCSGRCQSSLLLLPVPRIRFPTRTHSLGPREGF